tara:strand:+ start:25 stop:369 length:345 start_codon:yes stop_codon:yes gene_type:complete
MIKENFKSDMQIQGAIADGSNQKTVKDYQIDFARGLSSNYDEVWGSFIYDDNTVNLARTFTYSNMDNFLKAWGEVRVLTGCLGNIKNMTISLSTYPSLSVYLLSLGEDNGDECE